MRQAKTAVVTAMAVTILAALATAAIWTLSAKAPEPPEYTEQTISGPAPKKTASARTRIRAQVARRDMDAMHERIRAHLDTNAGKVTYKRRGVFSNVYRVHSRDPDVLAPLLALHSKRNQLTPDYQNWPEVNAPRPAPGDHEVRIRLRPIHHRPDMRRAATGATLLTALSIGALFRTADGWEKAKRAEAKRREEETQSAPAGDTIDP